MYRLTTDNPSNNLKTALNFFYAKDNQAMTRCPDKDDNDMTLYDFIRKAAAVLRDMESYCLDRIAGEYDDDMIDAAMEDQLTDGLYTPEGVLAHLYMAGWAMAELRARLKKYEDAEEEGRLWMTTCKEGDIVYRVNPKCPAHDTHACPYNGGHGGYRCQGGDKCDAYMEEAFFDFYKIPLLGKTIFPTQEEAEAALASMNEQEES